MRRGYPVLQSRDMQEAGLQIHLVPAQRDELRDSEPMSIGEEEEGAIARPVSAEPARGLQDFLDLIGY